MADVEACNGRTVMVSNAETSKGHDSGWDTDEEAETTRWQTLFQWYKAQGELSLK